MGLTNGEAMLKKPYPMINTALLNAPWYILQVRPRSEKQVCEHLKALAKEEKGRPALNLVVCVPTQRQLHQWSDRRKWVDMVLFSRYVFISIAPSSRNEVFISPHILGYLRSDGRDAILTDKEVALIKGMSGLAAPIQITYESCCVGDRVEVLSGPLMGHYGWVRAVKGKSRLVLELPSLGCFVHVEVGDEEIKVAN
jgi:transcription antitermination factor NusG